MEELRAELQALKDRIAVDKATMDALRNMNDALTEKLREQEASPAGSGSAAASQLDGAAGGSSSTGPKDCVIYLPKEKKCRTFSGGSCADFYEWLDEINSVLSFRHFQQSEKAMYIYDHLGGEAKQEIKYRSSAERADPDCVLAILKEIYGQPSSLTRLQKLFFDRKQRDGETIREYSHALMAIIDEINRCEVNYTWCSDFALRDQFAENVRDSVLRRELKRIIRQDSAISFFNLRKEALQWEDGDATASYSRRRADVCQVEGEKEVQNVNVVTAKPVVDPNAEMISLMKQQQQQITDLAKKVSDLSVEIGQTAGRGVQPRFDSEGGFGIGVWGQAGQRGVNYVPGQ
ncbi:uncharacterized protein LOC111948684 [Oryzias latipes]|uniref:uncharacterized protein LOC111948684 n=1 Tax=Oryzias latipes TaxID=8090 RepID=UPI000CE218A3|nr:uncharacterized protein LOC111948684 [Oryzias latipes]